MDHKYASARTERAVISATRELVICGVGILRDSMVAVGVKQSLRELVVAPSARWGVEAMATDEIVLISLESLGALEDAEEAVVDRGTVESE